MKHLNLSERKLILYGSIFISLGINGPKLFGLRQNGLVAHYFPFDFTEFLFQVAFNFLFCLMYARAFLYFWNQSGTRKVFFITSISIILFIAFTFSGGLIKKHFFNSNFPIRLIYIAYVFNYVVSLLLTFLLSKIIMVIREGRMHEMENEKLRNVNLKAEIELLKEQLNPHFFFNSLSSLSAIVREDPPKAQHYIKQLSQVFRYTLQNSGNHLVSLEEELRMITSYSELLKMRFESGFQLLIQIDEKIRHFKLPHMSLQPLIENAVKHNMASSKNVLEAKVTNEGEILVFSNNLQPLKYKEESNGIGLANLADRFKLLLGKEIEVMATSEKFTIRLPLKSGEEDEYSNN